VKNHPTLAAPADSVRKIGLERVGLPPLEPVFPGMVPEDLNVSVVVLADKVLEII
jgi:hypothetical protein